MNLLDLDVMDAELVGQHFRKVHDVKFAGTGRLAPIADLGDQGIEVAGHGAHAGEFGGVVGVLRSAAAGRTAATAEQKRKSRRRIRLIPSSKPLRDPAVAGRNQWLRLYPTVFLFFAFSPAT